MADIISRWHGEVVVMGDFNEARYASERHGSIFHASNVAEFNMFIINSHLNQIPLGGYSFTWTDKYAKKMSKLDHFLVSQGILDLFLNLSSLILHQNISDHMPILLKETYVDYGPTPFRLFHSWLLEDDFISVLEDSWNNAGWKNSIEDQERKRFHESLIEIDLSLDQGVGLPDDLLNRAKIVRDLQAINKKDSINLAQKAKVKWAIEGDENTKFFHGVVNKKRRYIAIKGILNDVPLEDRFPRRLNIKLSRDLERDVNSDEIKNVVWDCSSYKSPGPDGFTFDFFKKYWSIVGNDVVNAVKDFFSSSTFPNGCNPSFIALIPKVLDAKHLNDFRPISLVGCQYKIIGKILANRLSLVIDDIISHEQSAFVKGRQIMDGPIILNEVISWCKSKKEQSLLFKVDFQKAFDSVRWDHLDDILGKFGFGNTWRGWIKGCLSSSKASVFVNGSPTDEFTFHRGLRQGDPLSPFLFILVMESLHVSFQRLIDRGMFTPVTVGNDNTVPISHLFYADDAMFIVKWMCENVNVLMLILHRFFLVSGLKINVQKSSIFGIGVRPSVVRNMAARYGCIASTLSFTYLGVKVGANMKRISPWDVVINKVTSKLYTWKAKSLSVGEDLLLSYLSLVLSWGLWLNVIKAIYGNEGSLHLSLSNQGCSVWSGIIQAIEKLKTKGIDLYSYCKLVVGNGHSINFWQDKWYGEVPFKDKFKRCFNLELQKDIFVTLNLLAAVVLSDAANRWSWTLCGHGEFSVKSAREVIDQHVLITSSTPT
ncbi:RNA-directed DNA polymerase, eukaryota [Tanacetum coccineum]